MNENKMKENLEDKFIGTIVGAAVGDALGAPLEFLSLENRTKKHGFVKDFLKSEWGVGKYTDDTQLTLAIANSIIDSKGYNHNDFLKKLFSWYQTQISGNEARSPGLGTMEACKNLFVYGKNEDFNRKASSLGCGSAMRVSPIGLFYHDDGDKLTESSAKSSNYTHNNAKARFGAVVSAYAVSRALSEINSAENFIDDVAAFSKNMSAENFDRVFYEELADINQHISNPSSQVQDIFPAGFRVDGVVPQSLFIFSKNYNDFEKAVTEAANYGADSDSVGCIVGSIAGAHNGFSKIPKRYLEKLENRDLLINTGRKLYEAKFR